MSENNKNPKLDNFFSKEQKWKSEFNKLREIVLSCNLLEEMKWGQACYTFNGKNILIIGGFKEYCGLLFFKGSLLKDENSILVQQTINVQAARQIRVTCINDINKIENILKNYINQAIEIEKAGKKIAFKKTSDYTVVGEFKEKLNNMPVLKKSFEKLTPGRQRAYLYYFSQPKQSKTRTERIMKCIPNILKGKGLND